MSRIGRTEIKLLDNVEVSFSSTERVLKVKGPKGELIQTVRSGIDFDINNDKVLVKREGDYKEIRALHGLYRSLLNNMVVGVSKGFTRKLELHGVGYRAQMKGSDAVTLSVGFSHPVHYQLPKGITCKVEENNIILEGYDKQLLGQTAANIRGIRPPEPYKKKGIRYSGEIIRAKAGKTGK